MLLKGHLWKIPSSVRDAGDGHEAPTYPDTGKEEQATPRTPEAAAEGGQVRFDDEKLIGYGYKRTF